MPYSQPVFRPPAEANSLIVQLTSGCATNRCRFCPMYKKKKFSSKSHPQLLEHLLHLKRHFPDHFTRAFLADGDALTLPAEHVIAAMNLVRDHFPSVRRFGIYGSVFSLCGKTATELLQLKQAGLRVIYLGIESGDEEILRRMDKFMPVQKMIDNCRNVISAGLNLSVMIIIGLGGISRSGPHIRASLEMINAIEPTHTSLLNLMLDHTPLLWDPDYSNFSLSDYFRETATFIAGIRRRTIFRANHASNPVALEGVLPDDCVRLLAEITACHLR